ncbi:MAG: hypothetical protein EA361_06095 [Bacteroidetes bacterium]|nr:MAG: hypothetical protein EA361_06095 [Bacteroidota bacterium]
MSIHKCGQHLLHRKYKCLNKIGIFQRKYPEGSHTFEKNGLSYLTKPGWRQVCIRIFHKEK